MAGGIKCKKHVTPKPVGWLFTLSYTQVDVRPAVGWQAMTLNALFESGKKLWKRIRICKKIMNVLHFKFVYLSNTYKYDTNDLYMSSNS